MVILLIMEWRFWFFFGFKTIGIGSWKAGCSNEMVFLGGVGERRKGISVWFVSEKARSHVRTVMAMGTL